MTRAKVAWISLSIVTVFVLWMADPVPAHAQCGNIESTCYTCHQTAKPVCGTTDWHTAFAHRYACWNCHGGNDMAQDKEQAHAGLVANPLEDAYASCYPYHPNDYQQRARQLANEIGVPVSFGEPVITPSLPNVANGSPPLVLPTPAASTAQITSTDRRPLGLLVLLAMVMPLGWLAWKKQNRT